MLTGFGGVVEEAVLELELPLDYLLGGTDFFAVEVGEVFAVRVGEVAVAFVGAA